MNLKQECGYVFIDLALDEINESLKWSKIADFVWFIKPLYKIASKKEAHYAACAKYHARIGREMLLDDRTKIIE